MTTLWAADDDREAQARNAMQRGQQEAEKAAAEKAEQLRRNREANEARMRDSRDPDTIKAHQQTVDAYDPEQLRADVGITYRAALGAVLDGNLPGAIATHLAAIHREVSAYRQAEHAIANGAEPRDDLIVPVYGHLAAQYPNGRLRGSEDYRDHSGQPIRAVSGDALTDHAQRVYFAAIGEAARLAEQRGEQ